MVGSVRVRVWFVVLNVKSHVQTNMSHEQCFEAASSLPLPTVKAALAGKLRAQRRLPSVRGSRIAKGIKAEKLSRCVDNSYVF